MSILAGPPTDAQRFQFFSEPTSLFGSGSIFTEKDPKTLSTIIVLRESTLEIAGQMFPLMLVSDPLDYPGAPWGRRGRLAHSQSTAELDHSSAPSAPSAAVGTPREMRVDDSAPPAVAFQQLNIHDFMERLKDPRSTDVNRKLKL